ncbi:MAG TPA: hypothetical protein VFI53_00035 [Myxococcaceae bacterium]|nr:hypothetical protein [Myxococcaceae bacterium]
MAKKRKAKAKSDRALLELGEDLLTAVHLHQAIQENEVRAAAAAAHSDLVQAAGELVGRIAERFLDEAGVNAGDRGRHVRWPVPTPRRAADEVEVQAPADDAAHAH